jgi:hypothetical protein
VFLENDYLEEIASSSARSLRSWRSMRFGFLGDQVAHKEDGFSG